MKLTYLVFPFILLTLVSCEPIALLTTPKKQAVHSTTKTAVTAEKYFWKTLHQGHYQDIDNADYLLMAAYLENPNDPALAAHLGFLHLWKITERQRLRVQSPLITNEIILAKKYFSDAHALQPDNAIYQGFLGDTQLIEGQIFHDQQEEVRGYFTLKRAIAKWPAFNYFTAGYPMSSLPSDSKHFKQALDWQWATLDICIGEKINRTDPDYSPYMVLEDKPYDSQMRACWNSSIAPYNFEGFFMNMGDMLVKTGDWKTAVIIYNNAKLAKNYKDWPYRKMLEQRIKDARHHKNQQTMMLNSGFGCVACHQSGK